MNNKPSRNIKYIIYKIINESPQENIDLIKDLMDITESAVYLAPEIKNDELLWIKLHYTLTKYIGYERPIEEGWMKNVIDIYTGNI
jgi:hypothetical protein